MAHGSSKANAVQQQPPGPTQSDCCQATKRPATPSTWHRDAHKLMPHAKHDEVGSFEGNPPVACNQPEAWTQDSYLQRLQQQLTASGGSIAHGHDKMDPGKSSLKMAQDLGRPPASAPFQPRSSSKCSRRRASSSISPPQVDPCEKFLPFAGFRQKCFGL